MGRNTAMSKPMRWGQHLRADSRKGREDLGGFGLVWFLFHRELCRSTAGSIRNHYKLYLSVHGVPLIKDHHNEWAHCLRVVGNTHKEKQQQQKIK